VSYDVTREVLLSSVLLLVTQSGGKGAAKKTPVKVCIARHLDPPLGVCDCVFCAVCATLLTLAVGSVTPLEEAYNWDHGTVREDSVPGTEGTVQHCKVCPSALMCSSASLSLQ